MGAGGRRRGRGALLAGQIAQHHGQPGGADPALLLVADHDVEGADGAADVDRRGHRGDQAVGGRAVVGAVQVDAQRGAAAADQRSVERAHRLGQGGAGPAVQQAERLAGARIHRHPRADEIVTHLREFDAQVPHGIACAGGVEGVEGDGFLPDAHGGVQGGIKGEIMNKTG